MSAETIKPSDIAQEVLGKTAEHVASFSVALIKLGEPGTLDACLGGSGTLVRLGAHEGILTAAHVVDAVWHGPEFGVLISSYGEVGQPHSLIIDKAHVRRVEVPRPRSGDQSQAPDISLLILPQSKLGDIKARKVFYNLERHSKEALQSPPEHHLGFWALSGYAGQWTTDRQPISNFERLIDIKGQILWGFAEPTDVSLEIDAWEFMLDTSQACRPLSSFGGYSGGGLWQNLMEETKEGQLRVTRRLLSGVAYFANPQNENIASIRCNGRRLIYRSIADELAA